MSADLDFRKQYGPWAVVAGASEGMGAAYAEQLARSTINLILIARRQELLDSLARQLSNMYAIQVKTLLLDLSHSTAVETIVNTTQDLDVGLLVYNAAFSAVGSFYEHTLPEHMREIDTNIRTPLALTYLMGERLLKRGRGGIILMSSLSAFQGSAYISNYAATKAFNIVLAEGLWEEWRQRGVDVMVCVAGATRTPNYVASAPRKTGRFSDATLEPEEVVSEALLALGKQPLVIPGRQNRISSFIMRHVLPRRVTIQIMGKVLRDMYVH